MSEFLSQCPICSQKVSILNEDEHFRKHLYEGLPPDDGGRRRPSAGAHYSSNPAQRRSSELPPVRSGQRPSVKVECAPLDTFSSVRMPSPTKPSIPSSLGPIRDARARSVSPIKIPKQVSYSAPVSAANTRRVSTSISMPALISALQSVSEEAVAHLHAHGGTSSSTNSTVTVRHDAFPLPRRRRSNSRSASPSPANSRPPTPRYSPAASPMHTSPNVSRGQSPVNFREPLRSSLVITPTPIITSGTGSKRSSVSSQMSSVQFASGQHTPITLSGSAHSSGRTSPTKVSFAPSVSLLNVQEEDDVSVPYNDANTLALPPLIHARPRVTW